MGKAYLPVLAVVLALLAHVSLQVEYPPDAVTAYSSQRMTRYHHNFFHQVRMLWLNITEGERQAISKTGWAPPRAATAYLRDGSTVSIDGDVGEDFLYMHRKMIAEVNRVSSQAGASWVVTGWAACPAPGDTNWPVPPVYEMPGDQGYTDLIIDWKSDAFYTNSILPLENWLNVPANLQSLTLGELGVLLEFQIHTWMHVRFSQFNSVGYRTQSIHPTEIIDTKWDSPQYDWLADFYSAHVNPHFWKIHGWIEAKITAWASANSVTTIQWKGTWEGGPMDQTVLDELFQIAEDFSNTVEVEEKKTSSKAGVILGCVLGGLALLFTFTIIMTLVLRKNSPHHSTKTAQEGTA